jgi:hypothetical protein
MKDQPAPSSTTSPYRWVKLPEHCRQTGDTPDAVHARRRKRVWHDGVHCRVGPDGNLYVNPEEWNKWVESNSERSSARAA